jgi:hypothetical protein
MKERPILFSGSMVRALLSGQKTQTRRVLKEQPDSVWGRGVALPGNMLGVRSDAYHVHARVAGEDRYLYCPYGVPGDRLWVRETFSHGPVFNADQDYSTRLRYRANEHDSPLPAGQKWRPSIFMPRWASRITLEVTEVRVQRLQQISTEDIAAEGIAVPVHDGHPLIELAAGVVEHLPPGRRGDFTFDEIARAYWARGWNQINGKGAPWDSNPWVWAITFKAGSRG